MLPYLLALAAFALVYVLTKAVRHSRPFTWIRTGFVPAEHGLVPLDALDPTRAGPPAPAHVTAERQAVADAVWAGDWRPAAAYAEAAGTDWDERWDRLELLQHLAEDGDGWLTDWRAEQPGSCDAATVAAAVLLHRAWAVRGSEYARKVPAAAMAEFRRLLPEAMTAAQRAASLDPGHPGPWIVMATTARGMQYSAGQFQKIWQELCERAPHHAAAHWQALQYWCAKWYGSDEAMLDFATAAVRYAPPGSTLPGLWLHALYELETRNGSARPALSTDSGKALLGQVAHALALVPEHHEDLPRLRHLLAHYLGQAGLHPLALAVFRQIGPWCGAYPWKHKDKDPVTEFHKARGLAAWAVLQSPAGKAAAAAGTAAGSGSGSGSGPAGAR